jgi:hypothetical protein
MLVRNGKGIVTKRPTFDELRVRCRSLSKAGCCGAVLYVKQREIMTEQHLSVRKVRATLYLPSDVLEEARNATVYLGGSPLRLTLTKLAERSLRTELQRLKDLYNGGQDFPARNEDLKGGRPIAA